MSSGKKLSKELRREQLLDTALALIRSEGTGNLTLARLAEAAGVTKPIAYEHFETRAGLLMALFTRIDRKTEAAVMAALADGPKTREETLRIIAETYVDCYLSNGQAFGAILDALSAEQETREFKMQWRDQLATAVMNMLDQFGIAPSADQHTAMIGLFGAAETLCETVAAGKLEQAQAKHGLTRLFLRSTQAID